LLSAIAPFALNRKQSATNGDKAVKQVSAGPVRSVVVVDPEMVRAAVTVALDAAMPSLVDEISAKVLAALTGSGKGPRK
jgi:hypothetical protein